MRPRGRIVFEEDQVQESVNAIIEDIKVGRGRERTLKAELDAHREVMKCAQDECKSHQDRKGLSMAWCASAGVRSVDDLHVIAQPGPPRDLDSATEAAAAAAAESRTDTTE